MIVSTPQHAREATFDLTPMIDVVLLLIIFFSLTSQFSETQRTPVDLPREKGDAGRGDESASIVIDVDAGGAVTVLGQRLDLGQLGDKLSRDLQGRGVLEVDVIIRADRSCAASNLDRVVRALARAGIQRWNLATAGPAG